MNITTVMKKLPILLWALLLYLGSNGCSQNTGVKQNVADPITRIDMNLSANGVESDNFPSIEGYINFQNNSSNFSRSYYDPSLKPSTYKLTDEEVKGILALFEKCDPKKLKSAYSVSRTDQPTSTITIYTDEHKYTIRDYGLAGEYPLQELYKTAYKL